jgi:acetylornithine deacetylase/succinyl-diaminopimelate desuccinylase-like protein
VVALETIGALRGSEASVSSALGHANQRSTQQRWLAELGTLLAFPTVSSQPALRPALDAAVVWLAGHLTGLGLRHAQVLRGPNGGPPSVYADWLDAPGRPTLLCYGHFDVQPAGPLADWRTPPFQARIIGQNLFARGASDDKGQLFIHLKAIESYLATSRRLPLNIKVWLEGEEELGSPNLTAFLDCEVERLRADAVLISDTEMAGPGQPSIVYGLRGQVSVDVEVTGAPRDLHAGRYGGAVVNPLQALSELIAGLHDSRGRIAVPGVYARVRPASATERQRLRGPAGLGRERGFRPIWGEAGYSGFERTVLRPALIVQGLAGGKTGAASPAVIPNRARTHLSMRLVPDQEPAEIGRLLIRHLAASAPPGARVRARMIGGSRPVLLSPRHPAITAASRAIRAAWNVQPVLTRSGGTIPIVGQFHRRLGAPVVLLGFGLSSDAIHAPNEKLSLPSLFRGVQTIVRFFAEYAK